MIRIFLILRLRSGASLYLAELLLVHVTETSQTSFAMANATGARLRLHLQLFLRSVHHETLYILFFFFFLFCRLNGCRAASLDWLLSLTIIYRWRLTVNLRGSPPPGNQFELPHRGGPVRAASSPASSPVRQLVTCHAFFMALNLTNGGTRNAFPHTSRKCN